MTSQDSDSQMEILMKETVDAAIMINEDSCSTNISADQQGDYGMRTACRQLDSPAPCMGIPLDCEDNASRDSFAELSDTPICNTPSLPRAITPTTSRPSTPLRRKDGRFAPTKSHILNRVSSEISLSGHDSGDNDSVYAGCLQEYQWPKQTGEFFVLQEQVSKFLDVLSFKRKYPDIYRRSVDAEEKKFLLESKIVSNMEADMGLTALRLVEVHALMSGDYPDKYAQYTTIVEERRKNIITERQKQKPTTSKTSKERIEQCRKRAIKSAVEFNQRFDKERKLERAFCFDLQSYLIHKPRKPLELSKESLEKLASGSSTSSIYPVAVIPNQYQDYCQSYTSDQLFTLPLNSVIKEPPKYAKDELQDEYGEYYSDSEDSDISELSIDSNISDSMFEDVAQFAFASPAAKQIQLTERQKQLLQEQQSKQQQQMFAQDRRHKHQQEQRAKHKQQGKMQQGESKFHKWLKERELQVGDMLENENTRMSSGSMIDGIPDTVTDAKENSVSVQEPLVENSEASLSEHIVTFTAEESKELVCKICKKGSDSDTVFVHCSFCRKVGHAMCLDLTSEMLPIVMSYPWQCMDCKTCVHCMEPHHEDKMIFCDMCDRGFHTFCIGLRSIPTGRWVCTTCAMCNSCGARQPSGTNTDAKTTVWQHIYTEAKDDAPAQFLTTLCIDCNKLWERGHFCPICLKCFDDTSPEFTPMVCCDCCDRWIHPDCDNIDAMTFRTFSEHGQAYKCAVCRGEKAERYDKFHRKHRIQRYVEQSLKNSKVKKGLAKPAATEDGGASC